MPEPDHAPIPLGYATPRHDRWPRLRAFLTWLRDGGPWFPRPTWRTACALLLVLTATALLWSEDDDWRLSASHTLPRGSWPAIPARSRIAALPNLNAILSPHPDGGLAIWRPWSGEVLQRFTPEPGEMASLRASADGSCIVERGLGATSVRLRSENWKPHRIDRDPVIGMNGLDSLAPSPTGDRLVVATDKVLVLAHSETGWRIEKLVHERRVQDAEFSPRGDAIILSDSNTISIISLETDKSIQFPRDTFRGPGALVAFTPDGQRVWTCSKEGFRSYRLPHLTPDSTAGPSTLFHRGSINVVGGLLLVSDSPFRRLIDMDAKTGQVRRRLPGRVVDWGAVASLADGQEVVFSSLLGYWPGVLDTATGRHVGNLPLPDRPFPMYPPITGLIPSADGSAIAATMDDGTMLVYHRARPPSAWGMVGRAPFWLLALSVALLVASLARDAVLTRRRLRRPPPSRLETAAGALLITIGGAALVPPFTWIAMERWDLYPWWYRDGWIVIGFVLYLLVGLGLWTRSGAWWGIGVLLLLCSALISLPFLGAVEYMACRPERIFDRMWMIPPGLMTALLSAWAVTCVAVLVVLARADKSRHASPAPATVVPAERRPPHDA